MRFYDFYIINSCFQNMAVCGKFVKFGTKNRIKFSQEQHVYLLLIKIKLGWWMIFKTKLRASAPEIITMQKIHGQVKLLMLLNRKFIFMKSFLHLLHFKHFYEMLFISCFNSKFYKHLSRSISAWSLKNILACYHILCHFSFL